MTRNNKTIRQGRQQEEEQQDKVQQDKKQQDEKQQDKVQQEGNNKKRYVLCTVVSYQVVMFLHDKKQQDKSLSFCTLSVQQETTDQGPRKSFVPFIINNPHE